MQWPTRVVFDALQRIGLLGEYDGGSWSRLLARIYVADAPTVTAFVERIGSLALDERDVLDVVTAAYVEPNADFTRGPRAERDGLFIALVLGPENADAVRVAVAELAAASGVTGVVVDEPVDAVAIHAALGRAFAVAGKPERVFLVGKRMVLIREHLESVGFLKHAVAWEPDLGPLATNPLMTIFARAIRTRGCTRIDQVAALDVAPDGPIPAFTIRVLRRVIADKLERCVFVVSDGLRGRRLETTAEGSVARFELMTWTSHFDDELLSTFTRIGRALHLIALNGGRAVYPGRSLVDAPGGWLGWDHVLLSEFIAPLAAAGGDIDVLRAVPITAEESSALGADHSANAALDLVNALDAADFSAMLARWYSPPVE